MQEIDYIVKQLETLVNIPSPSGFTKQAIEYVEKEAADLGFETKRLRKGGTVIYVPGKNPGADRVIGLSAHVDTLGAMVRSINSNGTLRLASIGGFMMESIESTYCKVHTREGKTYTGTVLTKAPAVHTFDDARTKMHP